MVEFRNTPPQAPIQERDSETLLEDLCLALRDVAVGESPLPNRGAAEWAVRRVVSIAEELDARGVRMSERLDRLSGETGWMMNRLLADCRDFPDAVPHVRELDGVRRHFRCRYCKSAERPEDDVTLGACDACLGKIIASVEALKPVQGTVLFRTYNTDCRCEHADADTVLLGVTGHEDGLLFPGLCKQCLEAILARREAMGGAR